jgi:hypothetical protein
MGVMAIAHFCPILLGHIFHDFNFLLFFTYSVRRCRRKLVTADGGCLFSASVLSLSPSYY